MPVISEQWCVAMFVMQQHGVTSACDFACRGTGNNAAVQRLLHFAVSDVSDDVRRAAVLCLGFVLLGAPEQCPKIVALLAESFNPHVRYGAAMAIGIACAGEVQCQSSWFHAYNICELLNPAEACTHALG